MVALGRRRNAHSYHAGVGRACDGGGLAEWDAGAVVRTAAGEGEGTGSRQGKGRDPAYY
ncbi:hypothetical protein K438DRAFT_1836413 [Mycena galopus ATCC 62051]|nr:hypothetical protein K438DRAFT_1836413 [Mycena galopus ATCC 62051]